MMPFILNASMKFRYNREFDNPNETKSSQCALYLVIVNLLEKLVLVVKRRRGAVPRRLVHLYKHWHSGGTGVWTHGHDLVGNNGTILWTILPLCRACVYCVSMYRDRENSRTNSFFFRLVFMYVTLEMIFGFMVEKGRRGEINHLCWNVYWWRKITPFW